MAKDFIGYPALLNQAQIGLVRAALSHAASGGIMGAHHFYVTFDTRAEGVQLSQPMRERFPDYITIVLQNHYWNLKVREKEFEVGLSFNKLPETVVVPFAAVREFRDPSQNFGLQIRGEGEALTPPAGEAAPSPAAQAEGKAKAEALPAPQAAPAEAGDADIPTVVSLDKFRKK